MNTPFFSIITPVYNVESYLHRCVDSILAQSFQNWELFLIDDGSTDNSGAICEQYCHLDNRIHTVHTDNRGVSSARNIGLQYACGKWITFVDSDDWILMSFLQSAYQHVNQTQIDFFQLSVSRISPDGKILGNMVDNTEVLESEDFISERHFLLCVGGSFFKSLIIKTYQLCFNMNLRYAEDQLFIMDYMLLSRFMQRSGECLYMYFQNKNSATHNSKDDGIVKSIGRLVDFKTEHPIFIKTIDVSLIYFFLYLIRNGEMTIKRIAELYKSSNITKNEYMSTVETQFISNTNISYYWACEFYRLRYHASKCRDFLKKMLV